MGGFEVGYIGRQDCGAEVASFRFVKPPGYSFEPGQYFSLSLDTADGRQTKPFSHSAAPQDPFLELTTRLSGSAFKNALERLDAGDEVHVSASAGRLTLADTLERVAFLVGGVGITPVRSILRDAKHRHRAFADALVIYGNRDASCIPFLDELLGMTALGVRVVPCLEDPPPGWEGERGFITAEMARRYLDPVEGCLFVVAGPPVMVGAMERVLDDLAVPEELRLIERFGPSEK